MTKSIRERAQSFATFMSNIPPEEIARVNEKNHKEAAEQHKQFSEAFKAGQCSFCGAALRSFDPAKPCRHWLIKPDGVHKEHIEQIATQFSWGILENYLRWVANEEAFAKNINDLADEGSGKLLEATIKYKNLEWSFSCSENDLSGHEGGGEHSKRPHWHFQMYVDGKPFVRYNDFHLPLSEPDASFLEFMRANPGKVQRRIAGGAGMNEVMDESMLEHLVTMGRSGTTEEEAESAPIKLDTIILAEPGKTIRGEDIYNLIQQAQAEGVTATSKLRDLKNVNVQTCVSPGPGVVRQAPRCGRKRRGDQQLRAQDRAWREQKAGIALTETEGLAMRPGPRPKINADIVRTLREAIITRCKAKLHYVYRGSGKRGYQVVHPYGSLYGNRHYLVAWSEGEEARDLRSYALSNIERVELLDRTFTRKRRFSLRAYAERSFGVFQEEPVDVVSKFSPKAAPDAREFLFHPRAGC
jgi:hypothetical protein